MSSKAGVAALPHRVTIDAATWWPRTRVTPVFAELSLHIEPGQRVLLTGPNGCGKTVLLNAIQGTLPDPAAGAWRGTIAITEPTVAQLSSADPTSAEPASADDPAASVTPAASPPVKPAKVTKKALKAAFAAVGLRGLDPSVIDERVSGGQGQLVRIARQLASAPSLLVFDEPVSMLDPGAVATATSAIAAATARTGATLVVAAHRLTPWLSHVDRIVVMDAAGRIIADGPTAEVLHRHTQALLAAGIWVPGRTDPTPAPIGIAWDAPVVQRRAVIARAESVTVRHNDAALVAEGLPGLRREVTAIRDGDLDLLSGQCVALVGPTGAGGSSWLSALAGIVAADDGTISWSGAAMHVDNAERGGRPPEQLPSPSAAAASAVDADDPQAGMPSLPSVLPHQLTSRDLVRALGWMPQDPATTVLGATVRDDLLTTALAAGLAPEIAARRADVLLDALGLTRLATADPRTLSSGELRRLSLAGAVIHQPALLLADQPTIEQDRHGWAAVTGILESLRSAGSAVLVTTHDGGLTPYADRIVGVRPPRVSAGKSAHARPDPSAEAAKADLVVVAPLTDPGAGSATTAAASGAEAPKTAATAAADPAADHLASRPGSAPAPDAASPASAAPSPVGSSAGSSAAGVGAAVPGLAAPPTPSAARPSARADRSTSFGSPSYREAMGLWWVAFILVCGVFGFAGFVHFFAGAALQDTAATALWWAGLAMALLLGGRGFRAWWAGRTQGAARQDTSATPPDANLTGPANESGPAGPGHAGSAPSGLGDAAAQGDSIPGPGGATPRAGVDGIPWPGGSDPERATRSPLTLPGEQARRLRGVGGQDRDT